MASPARAGLCGGQFRVRLGGGRKSYGGTSRDKTAQCSGEGRVLVRLGTQGLSPTDPAVKTTMVYLATAHLNHDPTVNRGRNLKAFCQRCHMLHDRQEHRRRRRLTLRMRKAIGDLFLGPYQMT